MRFRSDRDGERGTNKTIEQMIMENHFDKIPFPSPAQPKFKFIDLFAGIGGFRIAFQELGGKCVFSSEINDKARFTYYVNFGDLTKGDITKVPASEIPDHDILLGGFPCQAFSIAGRKGGFEDTRGTLFFEIARILKEKKPRAFLLENVKGLTHHDKGRTIKTMLNVLRNELGYSVPDPKTLNAKDFGLPQKRERVFIVGFRNVEDSWRFAYPVREEGHLTIVSDVLEKEPVSSKYYLSKRYLDTLKAHRMRHESKGNGFGYEVISPQGIANTIVQGGMGKERNLIKDCSLRDFAPVTNIRGEINSECIRRMTPREWARLQGFSDNFRIPVSDTSAYNQFANSVPVNVVRAIGSSLLNSIGIAVNIGPVA